MGASVVGAGVVGPVALVLTEAPATGAVVAGAGVVTAVGSGGKLHLMVPVFSRVTI